MPDGILDLGLVVGPPGNITSSTVTVNPGHLDQPTATAVMGGVPGDQSIAFTFEGLQGSNATVPIATVDTAGKVKPDGKSIRITSDGTISVDTVAVATTEVAGTVKPDGDTISVDSNGTIKVAKVIATTISGEIPLSNLPQGALERVVTVADQAARFTLTTKNVQLGDVVKQSDTGVMYVVSDESKLSEAGGYTEFTAGTATKSTEANHALMADKVGSTTVGSGTIPVFIENGVPKVVNKVANAALADRLVTIDITSGTDLNSLTEENRYYSCQMNATVATLKNCPVDKAFNLHVEYINTVNKCMTQTLKTYRGEIWQRQGDSSYNSTGGFNTWVKIFPLDSAVVMESELPNLLKSNVEVIREALGIVTADKNGLVPKLPS